MRVMVLGDTHRDADFFLRAARVARRSKCDLIFQMGDFGYYDHLQEGIDFLRRVEAGLEDLNMDCYFLHGNHDGMVPLWSKYGLTVSQDDFGPDGINYAQGCSRGEFVEVREKLFYAPLGHRWEWAGTRFMAVGGAYSINRPGMIPTLEWWEEEELSEEQVRMIIDGDDVDIMLTHDAPYGHLLPAIQYKKYYPDVMPNRKKLLQIVETFRPQLLIHGHYHSRYGNWFTTPFGHTMRIEGLGANRTADFEDPWMVLELDG